jgi:hypothetical protein
MEWPLMFVSAAFSPEPGDWPSSYGFITIPTVFRSTPSVLPSARMKLTSN